jgi:cold shock CspA family protein
MRPIPVVSAKKDVIMIYGKVESFDTNKGTGLLAPESRGESIAFDRSTFGWEGGTPPTVGQRMSYEVTENNGVATATKVLHA